MSSPVNYAARHVAPMCRYLSASSRPMSGYGTVDTVKASTACGVYARSSNSRLHEKYHLYGTGGWQWHRIVVLFARLARARDWASSRALLVGQGCSACHLQYKAITYWRDARYRKVHQGPADTGRALATVPATNANRSQTHSEFRTPSDGGSRHVRMGTLRVDAAQP